MLNDHFCSVFKDDDGRNNEIAIANNNHFFNNVDIVREEIIQILKQSENNKSMGPDNIHIRVLKEGINSFSEALAMLFKKSIESSEIPEDWKKANIMRYIKRTLKAIQEIIGQ